MVHGVRGRVAHRRRTPRPMLLATAVAAHDLALAAALRADRTRGWYAHVATEYTRFLGSKGTAAPTLADLTPELVRAFVLWLKATPSANPATGALRPRSASTIRQYVVGLRGLVSFLLDEGVLAANPLARVRLPKPPQTTVVPFSGAEIRALLSAAEQGTMPERDTAILLFMVATGVRAAELCALQMADLDVDQGRAVVWGKGRKQRSVLFEDRAVGDALRRYLVVRPERPGSVFRVQTGAPLTTKALGLLLARLGARAGVAACHPHRTRHTYAVTYLAAHPGAIVHLRTLMGHSELATTERYARVVVGREHLPGLTVLESLGV